jgi:hypothetical protein
MFAEINGKLRGRTNMTEHNLFYALYRHAASAVESGRRYTSTSWSSSNPAGASWATIGAEYPTRNKMGRAGFLAKSSMSQQRNKASAEEET